MILDACCKINLGLRVLRRREDGFHDIETAFYPVTGLCDTIEVERRETPGVGFAESGLLSDCPPEKNLCVRAAGLLIGENGVCTPESRAGANGDTSPDAGAPELPVVGAQGKIPAADSGPDEAYRRSPGGLANRCPGGVSIRLHKRIPNGAGLGGGSSDAAAVLRGVNDALSLGVSAADMAIQGARLGSDVPFFLDPVPSLGTGRGERLEPLPGLDLKGYHILLVKPGIGVSTAEAYALASARLAGRAADSSGPRTTAGNGAAAICPPPEPLACILRRPVAEWTGRLVNDFEAPIFEKLPLLETIKRQLYGQGALYAAMSGSGSTIFGIFEEDPALLAASYPCHFTYAQAL